MESGQVRYACCFPVPSGVGPAPRASFSLTGAVIYRIQPTSKFLFASRVAATLNTPVPLFFGKHPRFFRVSELLIAGSGP